MDYFTFLGTGGYNGYTEINYHYEDDQLITKFVQQRILHSFLSEIDRVVVFCTEKSKELNGVLLNESLVKEKEDIEIEYVTINEDISSVDFIGEIMNRVRSEEIILDVTHIFRDIPMKLLFMIKYIELSKNIKIAHLFYGKIEPNKDKEGYIIDFIDDYHTQELSQALYLFDKTLYLSPDVLENYVIKDTRVEQLLRVMSQLNEYIETCNYDDTIRSCKQILKSCRSIAEEPDEYYVLLPFMNSIIQKFSVIECSNNYISGVNLIKVLLDNQKLQTALTFADNLFRVSLIEKSVENPDRIIKHKKNSDLIYKYSQELIYGGKGYGIIAGDGKSNNSVTGICLHDALESYLYSNDKVRKFYKKIRNKVNHGSKTDRAKAEEAVLDILEVIEEMEKLVRR